MNATEWLKRDHELILEGLVALYAVADCVQAGRAVPVDDTRQLLMFFREFADEYHHHKEENALFPALEAAGMPSQGPIGVMLHEHEKGRKLLQRMIDGLPELPAGDAFDYIDLLRLHIEKENEVLFYIADRMLSASTDRSISAMFSQAEDTMPHVLDHEGYRKLFARLRMRAEEE
ncbi:MAG: hemerythrin domain-containing protein [Polyangiaceae bacterium]|nr:hemerythrin domain-containing protein [Polyangiaceae bacterium]